MYRRWWKRAIFVALAAVVPVIANGFRVYFTVLIGETWGMKYATGTDHMIFGWQFFGAELVLLLLVGWFFRDPMRHEHFSVMAGKVPAGARSMIWPTALMLLVAAPVAAAILVSAVPQEHLNPKAPVIVGWNGPQPAGRDWRPSFQGAAGEMQAAYQSVTGPAVVELFYAVYTGRPRRGHSLITYGNDVYDEQRVRVLSHTNLRIALAGGTSTTASELRMAGTAGSQLVWYWYCVDSRCTRSTVWTKLLQAWDALRGRAPRSSVWALSTMVAHDDLSLARSHMRSFAQVLSVSGASPGAPHPAARAAGQ
jgi:EpsI family protein